MTWENIPILSDIIRILIVYSPRAVFALIALALGWAVGRLVGFLVNSIIGKMGLEKAFRKTSVGRAVLRAGYTPSTFFAVLGRAIIYLFAIFFALQLLSIQPITDTINALITYLPNLIGGVLILVVGFISTDWIAETIEKGSSSTAQASLLSVLVRVLLYFVIITIALTQMKIDVTILYIFAQAFSWSLAIALGVAFGWNLKDRIGEWLKMMNGHEKKAKNATQPG